MKWNILWRVTAGGLHPQLPIMTDCFTAVIMIHKEGEQIFDPQPAAPCVGTPANMQREPADLHQHSVGRQPPAAFAAAISLSAAYACLHSLAILPPSAPRSLLTTRREEEGEKHLAGTFPQTRSSSGWQF